MMTEAGPAPTQSFGSALWRYAGTWLCCFLVLWYGLQPGLGMACWIVIFGIVLCSPFVLHNVLKYRARRIGTLVRFGHWCAVAALLFVCHTIWAQRMERDAAEISARIEAYAAQHEGKYPDQIDRIGVFASAQRMIYYAGASSRSSDKTDMHPVLFYRSTWVMFDTYFYNFQSHAWEFRPD